MPVRKKKHIRKQVKIHQNKKLCQKKKSTGTAVKKKSKKPSDFSFENVKSPIPSSTTPISTAIYCRKESVGVDRLICPYNTFQIALQPKQKMKRASLNEAAYKKDSLTPRERTYLICSCRRNNRYPELKNKAMEAIKLHKIFLVNGAGYGTVRSALIERGWVEKIPPERMDVNSIRSKRYKDGSEVNLQLERLLLSSLVENCTPNFVWNAKDDYKGGNNIIYNSLQADGLWTSKQGLCTSARQNHWYHIEGVAEVCVPRTYTSCNDQEKEEFEDDYKVTACTSLLKWIISMVANERPIFSMTGKIGLNVLFFALIRCKEYVFKKQHKYIDAPEVPVTNTNHWNSFLKKYYLLIAKKDTFKLDTENKFPVLLEYAKFLLKEISRYRPQLTCEGCRNIWIIKPTHQSRGRGIRLASKLGVLLDLYTRGKYVFQKYIEEPLLIHETKFDIRQYYLITSTTPLVIWMYKDCYLKFSSQKYSLKSYHESIHLTNNAVQKKYSNCTDRHPELPQCNMWSLDTYREYLRKNNKDNVWDQIIYPGMRKSIVGCMLSCQDSIICSKNRFELYGCDFVLDKDYKPWLIEINSCPDLNPTTDVTAKICPAVISDVIKVVIDYAKSSKASTGKFECIYRQAPAVVLAPRQGGGEMIVRGRALPLSYFYRGDAESFEEYNDANVGLLPQCDFNDKPVKDSAKEQNDSNKKSIKLDQDIKSLASKITSKLSTFLDELESTMASQKSKSLEAARSSANFLVVLSSNSPLDNDKTSKSDTFVNLLDSKLFRDSSFDVCTKNVTKSKTTFEFSQLDDGPMGNGSATCSAQQSVNDFEEHMKDIIMSRKAIKHTLKEDVFSATKTLLTFLEEKEDEYGKLNQNVNLTR